ncbi:MAG: hypothetical protein JW909_00590 [Planctomycetes bacterium]|nr:hypothetical protein [Planctomycetota bacterium]
MSETAYKRVDLERVDWENQPAAESPDISALLPSESPTRVRLWLVLPLSLLLCVGQAVVTILAETYRHVYPSSTMIPVLAFGMLILLVIAVNPALRGLQMAMKWLSVPMDNLFVKLSRAELVCVFATLLVTAGISTYGLVDQLVPMMTAPWNPEWNTPQAGWDEQLLPYMNKDLYISDPAAVRVFREGLPVPRPAESAPSAEKWAFRWEVFKEVPWGVWLKPLGYWMIFIAGAYGMFYSLTQIVLGYWSGREKLIFPLAKLPEAVIPEPGEERSWVPKVFKAPGFWAGFALSFLVISWNAMVAAEWITGLSKITLGMSSWRTEQILQGSFVEGLTGGYSHPLTFLIIFTAIGIAFLLPTEISFSAWFYFLFAKFMLLVAVWLGYGRNMNDFPTDWLWMDNPISAQGAGGILLFSAVSLYRSIRQYFIYAKGKRGGERIKLMLPVIGLAVSLAVVTLWLNWNWRNYDARAAAPGDAPGYFSTMIFSMLIVGFLTLITLGLMRIVAEGGIYWFQSHASFFHSYKMLGMGKYFPSSATFIGPLIPIYQVLFLDIKTFLAPSLLNAGKMREDTRAGRGKYHLNMVVSLAVTVLVSLAFTIFLAYMEGGQQMDNWFYSQGPSGIVRQAYNAATSPPSFRATTLIWYAIGAAWTAISMLLRQTLFWFPHPIGYIMLVNPLMSRLWFSFFIGWAAKKVVVRYGGKSTYDRVRLVFIGLIMGELLAVFLWNVLSLILHFQVSGIDLNRYSS